MNLNNSFNPSIILEISKFSSKSINDNLIDNSVVLKYTPEILFHGYLINKLINPYCHLYLTF